jgi:hypothetical protein
MTITFYFYIQYNDYKIANNDPHFHFGIHIYSLDLKLNYHTVGAVLKYHTVRTVTKYHTVRTVTKYHTVGTGLKYHTVATVLKYHTVGTVWYFFATCSDNVVFFGPVPTVWYIFGPVPTVWYFFGPVPTVWYFFQRVTLTCPEQCLKTAINSKTLINISCPYTCV